MKKAGLFLIMLIAVATPVWAISNPARQYEQQRGTEAPADGIWRVYDRNNMLLREENYRVYRLHGDYKVFYPSGALKESMIYNDGYRDGPYKTYYESGKLQSETTYVHNNFQGLRRYYYDNGELESEFYYKDGNLNGEKKIYYKNGQLKQVLFYKDGMLNGMALTYAENGQVMLEEQYRSGSLISRNEYTGDLVSAPLQSQKPVLAAQQAPTPDLLPKP